MNTNKTDADQASTGFSTQLVPNIEIHQERSSRTTPNTKKKN